MALPKYIALKARYNGKYMRFVNDDSKIHGFIKLDGEEAVTPFSIFEVEPSKTGEGMVHLKSIYNNKYFVRENKNANWIKGDADDPEEDQSIWSCTLFKLILDEAKQEFLLWHVQLRKYAVLWRLSEGEPLRHCLFAGLTDIQDYVSYYTMVDLESLFVLPKRVALKGTNGLYLSPDSSGTELLRFSAGEVSDPKTLNVVKITSDGSINVSVASINKYWKSEEGKWNWVLGNADGNSLDADSSFWPLKIEKDVVALRNLGNTLFCKRLTTLADSIDSGLSASAPDTSDVHTKLWVVEPVAVREIFDINYQQADSKIYDKKTITIVSQSLTNTSEKPQDTEFQYTYVNITTGAWNSTVWPKLFSTVHLRTDAPTNFASLPSIDDENYVWGETKTITNPSTFSQNAVIRPKTKMTIKLVATSASFDIPFFYTQQDTLATGEQVTYKLEDGIFSGCSYYGFKVEFEEVPIP